MQTFIFYWAGSCQAIEEPNYEVVRSFGNVELRRYAAYVVAEVVLDTSAEEAGSQAFPILAGYIFGKNKGGKTFAMTAPVTQTAAPTRLDMTAPVSQASVAGGIRVQFVLPKELTLATAPEPSDRAFSCAWCPLAPGRSSATRAHGHSQTTRNICAS